MNASRSARDSTWLISICGTTTILSYAEPARQSQEARDFQPPISLALRARAHVSWPRRDSGFNAPAHPWSHKDWCRMNRAFSAERLAFGLNSRRGELLLN